MPSAMNDKKLLFWLILSCKNVNKAEMNEQIVNKEHGHHFVLWSMDSVGQAEPKWMMKLLIQWIYCFKIFHEPFHSLNGMCFYAENISQFWWIKLNIIFTNFISRLKWIWNGWATIWIINFGLKFGVFAISHCVSKIHIVLFVQKYSHVCAKTTIEYIYAFYAPN